MRGSEAISYLTENFNFTSVLDIGVGAGDQSQFFLSKGKTVTGIDLGYSYHYRTGLAQKTVPVAHPKFRLVEKDFNDFEPSERFDCVWACHVLEHQENPVDFLRRVNRFTEQFGVVAVTVPPAHSTILGGHLNIYNTGTLLYQMVMAGFDCSQMAVKTYEGNISVVGRKYARNLTIPLTMDTGDVGRLRAYFPEGFNFEGAVCPTEVNWGTRGN